MKILMNAMLFILLSHVGIAQNKIIKKTFSDAEKQTEFMLQQIQKTEDVQVDKKLVSPRTQEDGVLKLVPGKDWTSGFFSGELWYLYEYTHLDKWKMQAEIFTQKIEDQQYDRTTHDLGFKIYCSAGNAYRLTKDKNYKEVVIQAAKTLSKRFNPLTGTIKSWDHKKEWQYPVIIDNMMNLELLFEATKLTGDSSFYKIAITHANSTIKNHFRMDYSSYHVVDYDTVNAGQVVKKITAQGYSDESAWARGQAWGLYGYTMCFRETKNELYLKQAEHIAEFILKNPTMPKDLVPYWDFNDPGIPNEPRDASAAAIIASALYELSTYSKNKTYYLSKANTIVKNLTTNYRSAIGDNNGFLLLHSTGFKLAKSEVDVPLIYADYYYLEALLRSNKLKENKPLF